MSEQHVEDLLPAYAIGSLDPEDERLVAAHLADCAICQESLSAYETVVGELPLGVPQVKPPDGLRQAILQQVDGERSPRATPEPAGWLNRMQNFFAAVPAWGWVGLALIVILGVSNFLLWRQLQSRPAPTAMLVFTLQGTDAYPQGEGLLVLNRGGTTGNLIVDQLDLLDESLVYQLWLISGDERTSGGVFSVDEEGYGRLYVHLPDPLETYTGLGVTIEPAGGSPGPTGKKVLGLDL